MDQTLSYHYYSDNFGSLGNYLVPFNGLMADDLDETCLTEAVDPTTSPVAHDISGASDGDTAANHEPKYEASDQPSCVASADGSIAHNSPHYQDSPRSPYSSSLHTPNPSYVTNTWQTNTPSQPSLPAQRLNQPPYLPSNLRFQSRRSSKMNLSQGSKASESWTPGLQLGSQYQYNGLPPNRSLAQPFRESSMRGLSDQFFNQGLLGHADSHSFIHLPPPVSPHIHQGTHPQSQHYNTNSVNFDQNLAQGRTLPQPSHDNRYAQSMASINSPALTHVKRETSSSRHTVPSSRPRRTAGRVDRHSNDSSPGIAHNNGAQDHSHEDSALKERLYAAMMDSSKAEDNDGMLKTWAKLSQIKNKRVHEMSATLVGLIKLAMERQVGDKKALNTYRNFEHRFDEMCQTLKTQKTVCKHLLEDPYSHIVANDPAYAAQRVINNRRVNDQKKQAINVGRKVMGQKGQGKGRKISLTATEDLSTDEQYPNDEELSECSAEDITPEIKPEPRRKRAKKTRRCDDEDGDLDYTEGRASKQQKRNNKNSIYQVVEGFMVENLAKADQKLQRPDSTPPAQSSIEGTTPQVQSSIARTTEFPYAPTMPQLPSGIAYGSHGYGDEYNGYHSDGYNFSSGHEHVSSDGPNVPYADDADAYGEPDYVQDYIGHGHACH